MQQLEVMPNLMPDVRTWQRHILDLTPACPVSQNPKAGSKLEIAYRSKDWHLEVYVLKRFVDQFKGGLKDASGVYLVRDQEHMIQYIAQACADAVQVEVTATADLILEDGGARSLMSLSCKAKPQSSNNAPLSQFAVNKLAQVQG